MEMQGLPGWWGPGAGKGKKKGPSSPPSPGGAGGWPFPGRLPVAGSVLACPGTGTAVQEFGKQLPKHRVTLGNPFAGVPPRHGFALPPSLLALAGRSGSSLPDMRMNVFISKRSARTCALKLFFVLLLAESEREGGGVSPPFVFKIVTSSPG